jgi:hypothetical protein
VQRTTFGLGLNWVDGKGSIQVLREGNMDVYRNQFKFDGPNRTWLDVSVDAPALPNADCPHLNIEIRIPCPIEDSDFEAEALFLANEINKSGNCCAVSYDSVAQCFSIKSN